MRFSNNTKGSISVFLVLILFPFFTCFYLGLLSIRKTAADRTLHSSMNLAGNGALHIYNPTLKKQYGIFAVSEEEEILEHKISGMLSNMVESNGMEGSPLITLSMNDVTLTYPDRYSLYREEILEQQILEYMKYRAPIIFAEELSKKISMFFQIPLISRVMEKSGKYYDSLGKADESIKKAGSVLLDIPEELEIDDEKKIIKKLMKEVTTLEKNLSDVSEKADEWNTALEGLEDGELKDIFIEDYKEGAEFLTSDKIIEFKNLLEIDLIKLDKAEDVEENPPELEYKNHGLYKYLIASNETDLSEESCNKAKDFKDSLSQIAGNKEVVENLNEVSSEINIGELLPAEFRHVESSNNKEKDFTNILNERGKAIDFRNSCFLEEYIYLMFSSAITSDGATAPTNRNLSESPLFGCEMEYILFGNDKALRNTQFMKALLFQIRLLLNSCYLFSNVEKKTEAMTAAIALSAVTGLGPKTIQYALLILWATAETVLDISTLMKGKSVPIYKTRNTWTLSMNGIAEKVKNDATEYTCNQVDDIYIKIIDNTDKGFDKVEENLTEFFRNMEQGVSEKIANNIMLPVESYLSEITKNCVYGGRKLSEDEIKEEILKVASKADNGYKGFNIAYEIFKREILDEFVDRIYEPYSKIFINDSETISQSAAQKIEEEINKVYIKFSNLIEEQVLKKAVKK